MEGERDFRRGRELNPSYLQGLARYSQEISKSECCNQLYVTRKHFFLSFFPSACCKCKGSFEDTLNDGCSQAQGNTEVKNMELSTQKGPLQHSSIRTTSKRLSFCSNAEKINSKYPYFKHFDYDN